MTPKGKWKNIATDITGLLVGTIAIIYVILGTFDPPAQVLEELRDFLQTIGTMLAFLVWLDSKG